MPLNVEFKARCANPEELQKRLAPYQPLFAGEDHQVDTYFNTPHGRLKLREGRIENALIHYKRSDVAGAKQSEVLLYQHQPESTLRLVLAAALGIYAVVDKHRRIYFMENVKFHFDEVAGLGTFVEVEAIDNDGTIGWLRLQEQCEFYARLFAISPSDYIAHSYSDMVRQQQL